MTLFVSSNCTDTDFTVKVTDVYPDGQNSILVTDSVMRMRWRDSISKVNLMVPGEIYQITIDLWHICYIFNQEHRIRIAVSSSNYPKISANRNNGKLVIQEGPFINALNTLYVGGNTTSYVRVPLVTLDQIPNNVWF